MNTLTDLEFLDGREDWNDIMSDPDDAFDEELDPAERDDIDDHNYPPEFSEGITASKKTHLYDVIKKILEAMPETRDQDSLLILEYAKIAGLTALFDPIITFDMFKKIPFESIVRIRRMVQKDHRELGPSTQVSAWRKAIREQKGTHVFRLTTLD